MSKGLTARFHAWQLGRSKELAIIPPHGLLGHSGQCPTSRLWGPPPPLGPRPILGPHCGWVPCSPAPEPWPRGQEPHAPEHCFWCASPWGCLLTFTGRGRRCTAAAAAEAETRSHLRRRRSGSSIEHETHTRSAADTVTGARRCYACPVPASLLPSGTGLTAQLTSIFSLAHIAPCSLQFTTPACRGPRPTHTLREGKHMTPWLWRKSGARGGL